MEEDTLLQDLEQVYGLNDDVETLLNYARYVDLRLAGEIKEIGNYNLIIKCPVDYSSTTTQICSNCATIEALQAFQDYKNKQDTRTTKMKKITKDNLLKLVELKIKYIQTKDEKILEVINEYISNVINKDKHYYSKLKSYNFSDDILKYLL